MSKKVNPISYRLGINKNWLSRWMPPKGEFGKYLKEDQAIREVIKERLVRAGVANVQIERTPDSYKITIKAARPGIIIGRGGKGIEDLIKDIQKAIKSKPQINLNVEEVRRTEVSAPVMAKNIAWDLERRMRYRRVLKRHLDIAMQNREIQGAKIMLAGRLNGAEIARKEHLMKGKLPLTTIRANIDYGETTAATTYGSIGIKVWLYKGQIFDDKEKIV
ncbi:MAG: 30S ribosomal protein S3 [Candidatus Colwellbacteria bacterium CG10_big_fil_rev_8_21_14_0_10_41_28]|uniref:Small ribosomal subunit protein uS3 n=1 Tax=Candidatus Colwellbacteria bacterium CG10_big_fil_rev_8_21_14_0_10_41_28 TaxID=1974539 RepID=A0A2H0VJE8_9BACT|nr:MAG: 30S ribosomal protein S3 [Candidatus Colwellbacteria bacterium CG10_big_fil_rev_8_21_14_0_10_41_28]